VDTAIGPEKLIPGGRYSVNFAVAVATGKYADHLPLDRQVKQMVRAGLVIDGQTLWDQLWALYAHLLPTYEALHRYVLASPVIGADETRWPLLEKGKTATWWGWSVTCPDAVCYRILPSRSAEAAGQVLIDYGGVVIADGYSAYSALQKERRNKRDGPRFELAFCWAHVRRKFIECEEDYPQASDVLKLIGKLYEIEARVCEADVADRMSYLAELREKESAPVVREIHAFLLSQRPLPQSSFGKAVAYTLELWNGLVKFLKDPVIAIDNNATERTMRGMAVGRKNHYGSKSKRGTEVAALFYSLIESAKLAGLEPSAYLAEAARRAINNPGTVTLPQDLLKEQNLS
jgi:transposase